MKFTIISTDHSFLRRIRSQACWLEVEKNALWQLIGTKTYNVPVDDYIVIAADLDGHVGEKADRTGATLQPFL